LVVDVFEHLDLSQDVLGVAAFPPRTLGQGLVRQVDRVEMGHTID